MDDLSNPAALGAGVATGYELARRLLGPSADMVGERIRDLLERGGQSTVQVLASALRWMRVCGTEPGFVNSRILRTICEEAPFLNDALASEYFGGLLACAGATGNDDDLLPYVHLVRRMSTRQLRLHYIVYTSLVKIGNPKASLDDRELGLELYADDLDRVLPDWREGDGGRLRDAVHGLIDIRLLGETFGIEVDSRNYKGRAFVHVTASRRGHDLLMRVLGLASFDRNDEMESEIRRRIDAAHFTEQLLPRSAVRVVSVRPSLRREVEGLVSRERQF